MTVKKKTFYSKTKINDTFEPGVRKTTFCENKDADQLRGDREADQRLCFRYIDSTIPVEIFLTGN